MKALVCILTIILAIVPLTVNQTHLLRKAKNSHEQYAVTTESEPSVDPSIGSSNEYCSNGICYPSSYFQSQSGNMYQTALLVPKFIIGSYFLLSALLCALFNTCTYYPTVTLTTSVTVTNILTSTSTTPTTTTTRTTTATPTTKTTTKRTKRTTILPTTSTSTTTTRIRTTTTEFPTITTTTTSTTPTTTTTTPRTTSTTSTITTSITTSTNLGGRAIDLDEDFWKDILSPDDVQGEIAPSEIHGTFQVTQSFKDGNSAVFVHEDSWTLEIISSFSASTVDLAIATYHLDH